MVFKVEDIREIAIKLFLATGSSIEEAELVANELIETSLMGLDSHGVMRISQYITQAKEGLINPGAPVEIIFETPNSAIVDCNWNYGMLCANLMTQTVIKKAKVNNIAVAASRHCNHIGRLGSYTQKIANEGLFGFAVVNSSRHGHFVAPFGGAEGRLATNPMSFAVPTSEDPIVLDISTSMVAEGKIRVTLQQGGKLSEHCILDADGAETIEPADFYGPPRGTILPFGGKMGYKGFGLSLMVEILGSSLSGVELTPDGKKDEYVNGFFIMAINPAIFGAEDVFIENINTVKNYILSAKPAKGSRGVVMPGAIDFATRRERLIKGIGVADATWQSIVEAAKLYGIELKV
jgi:hydroxycarboxylate dehydrogenase B